MLLKPMVEPFRKYLQNKAMVRQEHLEEIMDMVIHKSIDKGEFLLQKGQVCTHSFFVLEGLVRFFSIDQEGKEHIVQFAPENWFISDRGSIFFGKPSEYFIDAIEPTHVVMLDSGFFHKATAISSEFRTYNEYLLQNHIRQLQNRINLLIGANAEIRYLDFLTLYPNITQRVPQWMVASYLGITPESLSRVRKGLLSKE
ncbi:Crp/Fnr family transcriptional regulator [Pararhodonellum marinum]|uniref:Crp/Fnr family transcriptional regulator n=1 Tax=Pararhodonellum marinum TaxID=2755358 RepID=UPI001E3F1FE0|nr:Crp/Fnr family transcriptional regulator [Pararhodonellum marinum]